MIFEEPPCFGPTFPTPLDMLPEPPEPIETAPASIQFSETGFVVVGAEHANSGQMMLIADAQRECAGGRVRGRRRELEQ